LQRALQFAARHDIGTRADSGERCDHRLVGIGFERETDERGSVGERFGKYAIVPLERRGRIAIEWCADFARERGQINVFGVEHAVAIGEVVHRRECIRAAGRG
jgi:hypothetical protein